MSKLMVFKGEVAEHRASGEIASAEMLVDPVKATFGPTQKATGDFLFL